jgi:chromosome segregation ATPase
MSSATIEASPRELANREWWQLAGEKERLDESIQRARRDHDIPRIFELQEQVRDVDKRMIQARAGILGEQIKEAEAEAARLQEQESEQAEQLSTVNFKLAELRDAAEQLEGEFGELNFARELTRNRVLLIRREAETYKTELRELIEAL